VVKIGVHLRRLSQN